MDPHTPENSLVALQQALVEQFNRYDNWKDGYKLLLDMGKKVAQHA